MITGRPLSVEYYDDTRFREWIVQTSNRIKPDIVFAYSSTMGQYLDAANSHAKTVVDYVDVDSEKWRAYADAKSWPISAIYRREWHRLGEFERKLALTTSHCVFVSRAEADLFSSLLDIPVSNMSYINNGVDLNYFKRSCERPNPYSPGKQICVFTGAMDYWANVDAVTWFTNHVFPTLRRRVSSLEFWIVGSRPPAAVSRLARFEGVHVTGAVSDIRPYLQHASIAVAPMRIARGVQNKVLEALAMGCVVVGTHAAFEGLSMPDEYASMMADDAIDYQETCIAALSKSSRHDYVSIGCEFVKTAHDWDINMRKLIDLLNAPH